MTTSDPSLQESPDEAFVWVWLPGAGEPVVAGRLAVVGDVVEFNYGVSYLNRRDAIALYLPEMPLGRGEIPPPDGMRIAGCISDAGPDAWGQRVIMRHLLGDEARDADPSDLPMLAYLLHAGSDRIGALDFQASAATYANRDHDRASLAELMEAADLVDGRQPLSPALDRALLHGSSVGGARPKALLTDGDRKLIAKFSSSTDRYPVVQAEFLAMELARRAGLNVAGVEVVEAMGRMALLVERFDRIPGSDERRAVVSALTILQLDEMLGRYATYTDLAQVIRERFTDGQGTLRELFSRIVFNVLVGNTDDHARNHAAFWDGEALTLTPAYDICPQSRGGGEASQAMPFGPRGSRLSRLDACVEAAGIYLVPESEAREIIDSQVAVIESEFSDIADLAHLTEVDREYFWRRQFLNPYAFYDYR